MNRTDRRMAIVLELRQRRVCRAEDLAALYEVGVRTIYRDIQALTEMGVPISSIPGIGYSLMEGYFLPPVLLHPEEAMLLLTGVEHIGGRLDESWLAYAQGARAKMKDLLNEAGLHRVKDIHGQLCFLPHDCTVTPLHRNKTEPLLGSMQQAVKRQQALHIRYETPAKNNGSVETERTIHPYGIVHTGDVWVAVAYCCLRQAIRHFRLDRIRALEALEQYFERPDHFSLAAHMPADDRNLLVTVTFPLSLSQQVKESRFYYMESIDERTDCLVVKLKARQVQDVIPWLLGWGAQARIIEPLSLAEAVKEEAARIVQAYSTSTCSSESETY
ncbi:helix-turn-helix transcriptional regulator [Paenibacillus sp. 481]|uniref:helix-turn-helix transcriptional regulator n=1 Tax=Paenibacillus sp. 481 TaxID=2835869 RepID=UPI001E5DCA1A|nr:YafY family protein [Paenibacillus sp. 481]UHA75130.1 YafY family transcriptional regulator [Paenibacillus sp. 481]